MGNSEVVEIQIGAEALRHLISQAALTVAPLDADYNLAGKQWREDKKNDQFWSRTVIRCLCADIEARLYVFRRTAIQLGTVSQVAFTKEDMEFLEESRSKVENGVPISKPMWLPIKDSVKE